MTDRVLTPRDWLTLTEEVVRLRAERDLLRAEVRAWRRLIVGLNEPELDAARAAVDAFDKEG